MVLFSPRDKRSSHGWEDLKARAAREREVRWVTRVEMGNKGSLKFERCHDSHQHNMLMTGVSMEAYNMYL